jgi:hypothetical protein
VAVTHVAVLVGALLALLCLPCAALVVLRGSQVTDRPTWPRNRPYTSRRESRELRRLDRRLCGGGLIPGPRREPPIEELAADLRLLHGHRQSSVYTQSEALFAAVIRAYDVRLTLASRRLGVTEHLAALQGADRDLERVRVEGELESAGLVLRPRR